jgi:cytochrome P450 family 110
MRLRDVLEWIWRPIEFLERNRRTYGPSFTVRALPSRPPIVWLGEPDAVRDLFAAGDDTVRAGAARGYSRGVVGRHSLLLLDGEEHRRRRRLLLPAFHGERLRAHTDIMRDAAVRAVGRWADRKEVRLLDEVQALAMDVILRAVFGVEDRAQHRRLSRLLRSLLDAGSGSLLFGLGALLGSSRASTLASVAKRASTLGPLRLVPAGVVPGAHLARVLAEVDDWLRTELAARRAPFAGVRGDDVLSLLLGPGEAPT